MLYCRSLLSAGTANQLFTFQAQLASDNRRQRHRFDFTQPISSEMVRSYKNLGMYDADTAPNQERYVFIHRFVFLPSYDVFISGLISVPYCASWRTHFSTPNPMKSTTMLDGIELWFASLDRHYGMCPSVEVCWLWFVFVSSVHISYVFAGTSENAADVINFMATLRAFVRQKSTAVALLTLSTAFVEDGSPLLHRLRQMVDVVFRLDPISVGSNEKSTLDYHGKCQISCTSRAFDSTDAWFQDSFDVFARLRSIAFHTPLLTAPTTRSSWNGKSSSSRYSLRFIESHRMPDLVLVQRLHLPPDLSETASRAQLDTMSCASGSSKSKLDFWRILAWVRCYAIRDFLKNLYVWFNESS